MLDKKVAGLDQHTGKQRILLRLSVYSFASTTTGRGAERLFQRTGQAQEERDHAMLFIQYLQNNGEKITLEAIAKPDKVFEDFRGPLTAGLEHENYVTGLIHDIYDAAYSVKDFRTMQFLDWFVKEQGEEEKNASELVKRFDLFGHDPKGLYMLDSELAARVYAAPSLVL